MMRTVMSLGILTVIVISSGCSGGGGGGGNHNANDNSSSNDNVNTNDNDNGNQNDNSSVIASDVTFPDTEGDTETGPGGGLKVVAIAQQGESVANFFGTDGEEELAVSGYDLNTGDNDFTVELDDAQEVSRVNIDDVQVDYEYDDDTYDFVVTRGDEVLAQETGVERPQLDENERRRTSGTRQEIVQACSDDLISSLADLAATQLGGTAAEDEFVECAKEQREVRFLAAIFCVNSEILIPAQIALRDQCPDRPHPVICARRITATLRASRATKAIAGSTLLEMIKQLHVDGDDDGVFDHCDNCVDDPNADQADEDGDGEGDVCDSGNTTANACGECVTVYPYGWCEDNDQCLVGSENGPDQGSCGNWIWTPSGCQQ